MKLIFIVLFALAATACHSDNAGPSSINDTSLSGGAASTSSGTEPNANEPAKAASDSAAKADLTTGKKHAKSRAQPAK